MQETHIIGCEGMECIMGSESEVWKEMEGGMVWCGVDAESKGRGK